VWRVVQERAPQLVHIHDFELLPLAFLLRATGCRVFYDVHEDVPRDVMLKTYLPRPVRRVVGTFAAAMEWFASRYLHGIVAATPQIARRFPAAKTLLVRNFPRLQHFAPPSRDEYAARPLRAFYAGTLAGFRGLDVMLACAASLSPPQHIALAGGFGAAADEAHWTARPEWPSVRYLGQVPYARMPELLGQSRIGLFVAQPTATMLDAYPTKVFEYLAAGLPAIVADWPLLRELFGDSDACLFVDPSSPEALTSAVRQLLEDEGKAWAMGQRGAEFVRAHYDWEAEAERLDAAYRLQLRA
jgi:glycosyltransferase involved in cell wall biosynthesis